MVVFLPPLYSDELLYSLLARVYWLTCSESPKQTLDELFGNRYVRAGVALQANLASLCSHLPLQRKLTPERLTRDGTLFPYLTAFEPPEVQEWTLMMLTEGNAEAVYVRLGLVAGVVRCPTFLRYCLACRAEMLTVLGELYWKRVHQLPGLLVCPQHGVPLANSMVCPAAINQHEFIAADEVNCPPDPPQPAWGLDQPAMKLLQDIAQASAAILADPPLARPFVAWGEYYRAALVLRGFGKGISNIDQESLLEAYQTHFGSIFSILPEAAPDRWLEGMTRKHRKAVAPLRHVLLRLLLDAIPLSTGSRLLDCGPWPCRNPLADHHGQPVVTDCHTHIEGGKTIGVFRCSCGYAFSQAAEPGSRGRILDRGPAFSVRLRELLSIGTGLRATARALSVDTNTIRHYVNKPPTLDGESIRARWSAAHSDAPELSRKQLRSRLPAEYAWLYRHDHDWLESHPPYPMHRLGGKQRRDWPTIDATMAAELRQCAAQMRAEAPPIPITRAALERTLGKPAWLDTRLKKLPTCAVALNELTEPLEAFQRRRIAWAVEELHRLGKPVLIWRLRRVAGLPEHCAPSVEAALQAAEKREL
jgi:hypothetical protein